MMLSSFNKTNYGFTLIELLVAMTMGLLVLAAILQILDSQNRANVVQQEVAYAQQNVRAAVHLMAREIRSAGYDPENSGLTSIPAAAATSIQVRADLDADGSTAGTGEDVTYSEVTDANGTYLARNGTAIVYDVVPNSLQFTYYQGGTTTSFVPASQADRDAIRVVAVQLQVHTEDEHRDHTSGYDLYPSSAGTCRVRTLATRARIRNMGFKDLE
ncbi:MAG TPA: prepilin-type N-terminal cleavage/methylation domain-containing protein [Desulfobacterales bacterium]|nr:prepilin-type N-terminal cleavage/methylation domain-containing protein [Desulfobacterales bacterium]